MKLTPNNCLDFIAVAIFYCSKNFRALFIVFLLMSILSCNYGFVQQKHVVVRDGKKVLFKPINDPEIKEFSHGDTLTLMRKVKQIPNKLR